MPVKGNLKDIGLTSLISINCNEMNQARLSIMNHGKQAVIFFNEGNIVHAELDSQEGEDVLFELLQWEEGDFNLEQGVQAAEQTVHTPWSGILLEGLQRIDERDAGVNREEDSDRLEFTKTANAGKVLAAVQRVVGVNAVLLYSREGSGGGFENTGTFDLLPALAPFIMEKAERMADNLDQRVMNYILLSDGKDRLMIIPYDPGLLIVSLSSRASVEGILDVTRQLQERYPLHVD